MDDDWFEIAQQRQRLLDVQARLLGEMVDKAEARQKAGDRLHAACVLIVERLQKLGREPGRQMFEAMHRWERDR